MISATIAKPGKKKTYEVVPQIVDITHAARSKITLKIIKDLKKIKVDD
jgi:hypothetical protein